MTMNVYVVGSLRNPRVAAVAHELRKAGFYVFDDWMAAGPEADDYWQKYETARGNSYLAALDGWAARHVFEYDKNHLQAADAVVLVLPAGRSAYLEMGWAIGRGKPAYVLVEKDPERWDVMLRFATGAYRTVPDIITALGQDKG